MTKNIDHKFLNTIPEMISFWENKEFEFNKSMDFLTFQPDQAKKYSDTLPFIKDTIEYLKILKEATDFG